MVSSARVERLEQLRETLETEYLRVLRAALQECAGGHWGMFQQNDHSGLPEHSKLRFRSALEDELEKLGDDLAGVRRQLGYVDEFMPMNRLKELRSVHRGNAPGEPKLAASFLEELNEGL